MVSVATRNKQRQAVRSNPAVPAAPSVLAQESKLIERQLQEVHATVNRKAKDLMKAEQRILNLQHQNEGLFKENVRLRRRPSIQSVAVAFGITLAIFGAVIVL